LHKRAATNSDLQILTLQNIRSAREIWEVSASQIATLKGLTAGLRLSILAGDLNLLDGKWYVTHAGLLRTAQRRRCHAIRISLQRDVSDPIAHRWVFKATVYKTPGCRGFVGFGDADPSNVSALVRGAEMRMAETRAVDRALRKAYGIGLCSVEELGSFSGPTRPAAATPPSNEFHGSSGSSNGRPRLRDQLCLLIRKYDLNPGQVKRYAADFCGTETLRDAGRNLVESFISSLADDAARDREGLICKLNSYGAEAVKS
jgi:hypothetical protein